MDDAIEKAAMRKVYLRLLPLTMLMYFLCYTLSTREPEKPKR